MPLQALPARNAFWVILITFLLYANFIAMIAAWTWAIGRLRARQPLLPEPKPRAIPWGTGSVLVVFVAWLVVNVGVSVGYLWFSGVRQQHRTPTFAEQMAVVSLSNGALLVIIPLMLRLTSRATLADLGVGRQDLFLNMLAGTVGFLLIAPVVYLLNGLAVLIWRQNKHPLEQMVVTEPSAGVACLAFLSAVLLAPAAEELIFRGIIQSWLTRLFAGRGTRDDLDLAFVPSPEADAVVLEPLPRAGTAEDVSSNGAPDAVAGDVVDFTVEASVPPSDVLPGQPSQPKAIDRRRSARAPILITSAVFAAVHLPQWPAPLAIFFLSVGLSLVYQRTGSLIASFLMHALFNGFSTMMLFLAVLTGHATDQNSAPTAISPALLAPSDVSECPHRPRVVLFRP